MPDRRNDAEISRGTSGIERAAARSGSVADIRKSGVGELKFYPARELLAHQAGY
jgi:hypothetical protein